MIVLGIETSCDETSLSLLDSSAPEKILKTLTYSQIDIYKEWGGVVPEIASRNHLKKILPLYSQLLQETNKTEDQIDLIGVTNLPGLLGPLLTGVNLAKSISLLRKTPIYPVNHLFAHIEAIHLTENISYPYLGVILSGGHSLFCKVSSSNQIKVLASTIDDAAGEAFDKGGKLLGLDYPAGEKIDMFSKNGDPSFIKFPRGLSKDKKNKNMSFSGIKTSLRTYLEKNPTNQKSSSWHDLCASYQEAIIQTVYLKLKLILEEEELPIVVGGGVACNSRLRETFQSNFENVFFVAPKYCTDNASMIANLAFRNAANALSYPDCLSIDASSRFIDKKSFHG